MDLQLKGKRAIVIGASRGIGKAIAEALADEGCDVAICARGQAGVDAVVASLKAKGVKAIGGAVDIADGPALRNWITETAEALGGLDVLVSNASALTRGAGEEDWKAMYDLDLMGAVRSLEAARPFLEKAGAERGDAAFIITSSVSAAETAWRAGRASAIEIAPNSRARGAVAIIGANRRIIVPNLPSGGILAAMNIAAKRATPLAA